MKLKTFPKFPLSISEIRKYCPDVQPKPFTGIPDLRPAAKPSNPVRMVNGKLRRPKSGVDWLLFGVQKFTPVAGDPRFLNHTPSVETSV